MSTASSSAFAVLNTFAAPPEVRVGRCTLRGAGDAIQPLKRRESARKARAGARETVMLVSEVLHVSGEEARVVRASTSRRFWPGVGELSLDKRLANLDTYPSAHT